MSDTIIYIQDPYIKPVVYIQDDIENIFSVQNEQIIQKIYLEEIPVVCLRWCSNKLWDITDDLWNCNL